MSARSNETDRQRNAAGLAVWENEGGTSGRDFADRQYGRRVEADRSWTVYHVFSGIPALVDGGAMTGLSRSDATRSMLSLNQRNAERPTARVAAPPIVPHEAAAGQP
ncbi:hypothetical protein LB561_12145 [Mesorhizobium sp. B292B1B]|uniref:hypothetical protein n=1 Tax=unclassified Mesorhizobium TaxID=325217 RepID=UPI0011280B57|nr:MULTISPECIES: hypothetical protein [unclassified Mesorhizobium]MCA0011787.1 hypothetical protein [Mesorhizobium sp. B294B1A1]MCA0038042.1 hypothetical protein [Mesorhizobium sp. B292B1B]TPM42597.1 hypothetical protein FJ964_23055 [Mesorhizobium sp. B2-3-2]